MYTQTDNASEADWFGVVVIGVPEPALFLLLGSGNRGGVQTSATLTRVKP